MVAYPQNYEIFTCVAAFYLQPFVSFEAKASTDTYLIKVVYLSGVRVACSARGKGGKCTATGRPELESVSSPALC